MASVSGHVEATVEDVEAWANGDAETTVEDVEAWPNGDTDTQADAQAWAAGRHRGKCRRISRPGQTVHHLLTPTATPPGLEDTALEDTALEDTATEDTATEDIADAADASAESTDEPDVDTAQNPENDESEETVSLSYSDTESPEALLADVLHSAEELEGSLADVLAETEALTPELEAAMDSDHETDIGQRLWLGQLGRRRPTRRSRGRHQVPRRLQQCRRRGEGPASPSRRRAQPEPDPGPKAAR